MRGNVPPAFAKPVRCVPLGLDGYNRPSEHAGRGGSSGGHAMPPACATSSLAGTACCISLTRVRLIV